MVYPALLPLMRTPRVPVVDRTDATRRFKWTRPFRRKTKSGFCACAITFQMASNSLPKCDHYTKFIINVSDSKTLHVLPSGVSDCYTCIITALIAMKFLICIVPVSELDCCGLI